MIKFIETSIKSLRHIHNPAELLFYGFNIVVFFLIVMLFINMIDNKRTGIYARFIRKIDNKRHNLYLAYCEYFKEYKTSYKNKMGSRILFTLELIFIGGLLILIKEEFELVRNNAFNYLCVFVTFYAIGFIVNKLKQ